MGITKYRTLSEALNQLRDRGYTHSYKLIDHHLQCLENDRRYYPDDLEIQEFHRFEGESNPSDMSIVFAINCKKGTKGTKGTVVSSYGTYADLNLLDFMDKVKIAERSDAAGTIDQKSEGPK